MKLGYSARRKAGKAPPQAGLEKKMTATRLNAAFAAVLATIASFAFAVLNMPAPTQVFLGVVA